MQNLYPYTEEEFNKIYNGLPEDLQEMVFSEDRSRAIFEIARRNNAVDVAIKIADKIEDVLIGFLPPKDFENSLKDMEIRKDLAKKIAQEVDQRIFSHVRRGLIKLYEKPAPEMEERLKKIEEKVEKIAEAPQTKVAPAQDVYREPIAEK